MSVTSEGVDETTPRSVADSKIYRLLDSIGMWIDERTDFSRPLRNFFAYPVPLYVHKNILYSLGGVSLISITLQMFTGLLLSFYYEPTPVGAYNSVDYVTYQMPLGWMMRGIHYYNASVLVILVFLHLLRVFFFSAYKKPREITWLSGLCMLLITLAFAFTGGLLPWDQSGYWATKVGIEIAGSAPLVGSRIAPLLRGGHILGQATLSRFFVIHTMLLPLSTLFLIGLHIHQLRFHGIAPPITRRAQARARQFVPFYPHWMTIDGLLGLSMLAFLIGISWLKRAPLEFPADPTSTDYIPRPEWYFLFLYQSLKYFPPALEPLAVFILPGLLMGGAILLPFLDRGEERRPWRKPITTAIAILVILWIVVMTTLALSASEPA